METNKKEELELSKNFLELCNKEIEEVKNAMYEVKTVDGKHIIHLKTENPHWNSYKLKFLTDTKEKLEKYIIELQEIKEDGNE